TAVNTQTEVNAAQGQSLALLVSSADIKQFVTKLATSDDEINTLYTQLDASIQDEQAQQMFSGVQKAHQAYSEQRQQAVDSIDAGEISASLDFFIQKTPKLLKTYVDELTGLNNYQNE